MDSSYSLADIAAVKDSGFGGSGSWLFFLIILFLFMGGGGWGGNNQAAVDLSSQFAAQTSAMNQQQILLSSANNNYETARLIDGQTNAMLQQNSTNLINAIQGFNTVNQGMIAGFNQVSQQINQLGYQLDKCCCDIKTQMLQNRLDDANAALVSAQGVISNANQSQYLLSMLGSYTPGTAPAAYSGK